MRPCADGRRFWGMCSGKSCFGSVLRRCRCPRRSTPAFRRNSTPGSRKRALDCRAIDLPALGTPRSRSRTSTSGSPALVSNRRSRCDQIQPSVLELELQHSAPSNRSKILAGILAVAALAIGGVGLWAAKMARETNLAMSEYATASATATTPPADEDAGAVDDPADAGAEAALAPSASTSASAGPPKPPR